MRFRDFYRLVFVLFSLYLTGDALYRWDGFSHYASFYEFLPAVALAFILWSIVAVLAAIIIWILFKLFVWFWKLIGIEIELEHLLVYACIFVLSGALVWKAKKLIWPYVQTTFQIKLVVFFCIAIISVLTVWLICNMAKRLTVIVQERITPLVWLFGIFIVLAVPLVSYYAWFEDNSASRNSIKDLSSDQKRPNIILVTFDALAARNMSVYGYQRETTPFINKWAENSTLYSMTEAASNFTTPAAASLMTGKRVWTHQTYHIEGSKPVRSNVESLPAVLRDNGYFNIALVVNPFASVRVLGISDSFDMAPLTSDFGKSASLFGWKFGIVDNMLYQAFGDKIKLHNWILKNEFILSKFLNLISRNISQTEVPPDKAFNKLLNILDNNLPEPFFAWIHIFPPHDPYLPPEPFRGKFNDKMKLRTYKKQEQIIEESYKYLFQYQRVPKEMTPSVDLMRDYYDEFITYIDKEFEGFIQELDKRKIENTIIVLTADHGESFEHGYLTHGGPFLYEQVTHIPLIIKKGGQTSGKVVSDIVEQIDIPATLLDLANIPIPKWMEGRSLVPLMHDEVLPPRPAFSMNFEQNRSRGHLIGTGSIAVWEGDYKLIHYLGRGESLLFNIKRDPNELNNLIKTEAEISHRLIKLIKDNLETANDNIIFEK